MSKEIIKSTFTYFNEEWNISEEQLNNIKVESKEVDNKKD